MDGKIEITLRYGRKKANTIYPFTEKDINDSGFGIWVKKWMDNEFVQLMNKLDKMR